MSPESYKLYFLSVLNSRLTAPAQAWLQKQLANITTEKDIYLAFSMAPRFTGKQPLYLSETEVREASQLRVGFSPVHWTTDQATRTLLLLNIPHQTPEEYTDVLNKIAGTANLTELSTLYAALPLLPYPETHVKRAAEGVRTTMTQVFDAIALNNPYPHDYLPDEAWNQMVLKSIFNVRPLYQIYGLNNRRNEALANIAIDYAHERWAAGRTLTPELWRLVSPYLNPENIENIKRLLQNLETIQQEAAALALAESNLPEAKILLAQHPELAEKIKTEQINWQQIGETAY